MAALGYQPAEPNLPTMPPDLDHSRLTSYDIRHFNAASGDPAFQPRTVVTAIRAADFHVRVAARPHASGLTLVVAGSGRWSCGGLQRQLGPGSIYVSRQASSLEVAGDDGAPMAIRQVTIAGNGFPDLCREVLGVTDGCWRMADPATCLRLFDLIAAEATTGGTHAPDIAADLIRALVRSAARAIQAGEHGTKGHFQRACRWLDQESPPTVVTIATRLGISLVHLCRIFHRHAGCPPAAWARARRLDRAAATLLAGETPVQAVANAGGWADPYAFSRAFRRRYGLSPQRWRRMQSERQA